MAIYRWVGSGTTASTSPNIFSWNNTANWREFKTYANGAVKVFMPTANIPGNGDEVYFGYSPTFAGITNIEKTYSPCLYGGFSGNAASGIWVNELGNGTTGTTLTSSLLNLYFDFGNGVGNCYGATYAYGDMAYSFAGTMRTHIPFGGGITSNLSCIDNILFIANNYPNMGAAITSSATAGTVLTVPSGYQSSWDKLNLKVSNLALINGVGSYINTGSYSTSKNLAAKVDVNFVTSYSSLTTSATGPVHVKTVGNFMAFHDMILSGGAFSKIDCFSQRNPGFMIGTVTDPMEFPKYPKINLSNMYVGNLVVPQSGNVRIGEDVRFIKLNVLPRSSINYFDATSPSTPNTTTISQNKCEVFGSGSVTQVNAVLYPGNSANTNNELSSINFLIPNISYTSGIANVEQAQIAGRLPMPGVMDWASLSTAHQYWNMSSTNGMTTESRKYFNDIENNVGTFYLTGVGQKPYTFELVIGNPSGTTTSDVSVISVAKELTPSTEHDYQVPVLKFAGSANVNSIYLGNYSMMECAGGIGKVNIGELKLGGFALLNLDGCDDRFAFGVRSSGGTTGGIMSMNPTEQSAYFGRGSLTSEIGDAPMGRIVYPSSDEAGDIKLFNVNTKKSGAIQVTESTIAEIAQISGTNRKG
jgi:hypothetical protein